MLAALSALIAAAAAQDSCKQYAIEHAAPHPSAGLRVLVTGGAGFVGSHVARKCLELGMVVTVVDDLSGGKRINLPAGVRFVRGDLKNASFVEGLFFGTAQGQKDAQLQRFDFVYHLAAYAAEGLSHFIRSYNYRNNLVASTLLINAAVRSRVRCFVFTSSIAVYGARQLPFTEDVTPVPEDPYGISKLAVELDLEAAHRMFGLNFVIARPHNVYGPAQNAEDKYRNVVGIFLAKLLGGEPLSIFGDGTQTRSFTYVSDVADVLARAPLHPHAYNQKFNVGAEQPYTVNELATRMSRAWGEHAKVVHLDKRNEVHNAESTHTKLGCYFPSARQSVSLDEGLRQTVAWAKQTFTAAPQPAEFDAVEVKRQMPRSWLRERMGVVAEVQHKGYNPAVRDEETLERYLREQTTPLPASPRVKSDVNVKIFAIYWPQWHTTPLNDYWFGTNFTDWELLCNYMSHKSEGARTNRYGEPLLQPLQPPNGLGYYDLNDYSVRRRQAQLAKEYGVHGFVIYHYWFARDPAWGRGASWNGADIGADMDESVMKLLDDGEPDIPFYFLWANQAFVWRWKAWGIHYPSNTSRVAQLKKGETQVPQTYPEWTWRPHFDYLLPFFRHKNYHKINGWPVLGLHTILPIPPAEMWVKFQQWAREAGLPGIYVLQTFYGKTRKYENGTAMWKDGNFAPWAHGIQEFGWQTEFGKKRTVAPAHHKNWSHGIICDFDNTPRMLKGSALIGKKSASVGGPQHFESGMDKLLNATIRRARKQGRSEAQIMVVAWNEWTEQAVLEPSDRYGIGYLQALRTSLMKWGQYRYDGPTDLWRQGPRIAQLTRCGL